MPFELDEKQKQILEKWMTEQDQKVTEKQNKNKPKEKQKSYPNYGCSGGAYTYHFTPTWIGMVIKVSHCLTKETIDLTDYDNM